MVLVTNEEFLLRLETAFQNAATKGTVFLSMKRQLKEDQGSSSKPAKGDKNAMEVDVKEEPGAQGDEEFSCLMRAKQGSKTKFSTLIHPDDTDKFLEQYAQVVKRNASNLFPESPVPSSVPSLPSSGSSGASLEVTAGGKKKGNKAGGGGVKAEK
ncbi:signal recognition particle 14kD protein-domain-containing protein [Catenaria anguillulae PL171]|uniref:Signal recognition particle subunit SRP14 n=1 Tax=Catenaria anguillulae PL171 TaxID=765915 RepID=A0A1Y2HL54_9FUNG|nr:signal recognition particle 14kD protein-domain-containing protein [Catenaria anguillulae PL171]